MLSFHLSVAFFIAASFIWAQAVPPPIDPVGDWYTRGVGTVMCGLLVYLVTVLAPRALREVAEERERLRISTYELLQTLQDRFDQRNMTLANAIEKQTKDICAQIKEGAVATRATIAMIIHAQDKKHGPFQPGQDE